MNAYKEIQNALLRIKAGYYNADWGICTNLEFSLRGECFYRWRITSKQAFEDWPKFSGSESYPVPSNCSESPAWAYVSFNKWSKYSEYGRDRWGLLEHLIKWYGKKADVDES